ncbi:hypothetical protein Q5P01_019387 [Channa striata]|uniref:BTB domain-containing protein n=1 Tax=Channa striata TaxID=64152 RepID=A0AA88M2A4_CHASR|nr:hypothetical protein Q5P01_019387 [Channa striata]
MITSTRRVSPDKSEVRIAFSLDNTSDRKDAEDLSQTFPDLEQRLQPVPPCVSLRESVQVYKEHCRMAKEFHQVKHEIAVLEDRKRKLLAELVEDEKVVVEIARLEEEFRRLTEENLNEVNVTAALSLPQMSQMAMSASRSSVFTFESTVHSSHVLRCLDEQRRRDTLCDVTVVAEGQSFRAHRSVLASCSEYFSHRISTLTQHGAIITLPQEVTAAGFEPLLTFAYTSKLHFGKDNVLEIRNSASILGFSDLDEACFDFLLPKFLSPNFSCSNGSAPFPRKTCCKRKCKRRLSKEDCNTEADYVSVDQKEVKPVADSPSQREAARLCSKSVNNKTGSLSSTDALPPVTEGTSDCFMQCPKYRKFQLACGKESCVTIQKSQHNPVTVIRDALDLPCPSGANSKNETEAELPGNSPRQSKEEADDPSSSEICDRGTEERPVERREQAHVAMKDEREETWNEQKRETSIVRTEEAMVHAAGLSPSERSNVSTGSSVVQDGRSPGLILHQCPQRGCAQPGSAITRSPGQEVSFVDIKGDTTTRDSGVFESGSIHQKQESRKKLRDKGQMTPGRKEDKQAAWRKRPC